MKVAVIMGSKSDLPKVKDAILTLKDFGIDVDAHIISAHRTPEKAAEFAADALKNGFEVIIAAAGKAAHLAGVIAANTILPVIGLPISSQVFEGMDALLSTVQMPPGIPVATVAIDGAINAALLAVQILSVKYAELSKKLHKYKENLNKKIENADLELQKEIIEW